MLVYKINNANNNQVEMHLNSCSNLFIPPLHTTVDIKKYAEKITTRATLFECWSDKPELIGLVALYINLDNRTGYITNVSVLLEHSGKGIANTLLDQAIEHCILNDITYLDLEVHYMNNNAIHLYTKKGFHKLEIQNNLEILKLRKNIK